MIDEFRGPTRWLSNFGIVPKLYAFGVFITTTEHGYQAAKCENPEEREEILIAKTPGRAKALGQKVALRPDWEDVKDHVMYTLLRRKFASINKELHDQLLATGNEILVEGNDWGDRYWGAEKVPRRSGIECTEDHWWPEDGSSDYKWVGKNQLGILLMQVRSELRGLRGL
jgi:ribA/ribD-fused uncharacterized protein